MKLMIDEAKELKTEIQEEINESTGSSQKNYYISGIFSTPDTKNRNGRIYPKSLWEREVSKYQKEIQNVTRNSLGESEHPNRITVDPFKAVMRIVEIKMDDRGNVVGKAKILNDNSPETNKLKALIDEGMKIGVSSRGVGKVGKNGIIEEFNLTTWDIVSDPSDYNSDLHGLTESLEEKNYEINEDGKIQEVQICTETECNLYNKEDVQKAILEKFDSLFKGSLKENSHETYSIDSDFNAESLDFNKVDGIIKSCIMRLGDIHEEPIIAGKFLNKYNVFISELKKFS